MLSVLFFLSLQNSLFFIWNLLIWTHMLKLKLLQVFLNEALVIIIA